MQSEQPQPRAEDIEMSDRRPEVEIYGQPEPDGRIYPAGDLPVEPDRPAAPANQLATVPPPEHLSGYRVRIEGNIPEHEALQDAAVLAYEFERRRAEWWRRRRYGMIGLPSVAAVLLLVALLSFVFGPEWSGRRLLAVSLAVFLLALWLVFAVYCWLTLPRVLSFGRAYRRLVSVPLARGGIIWCDAAVPPPDFPSLRDSFFTLYNESHEASVRSQPESPDSQAERKRQTLRDLQDIIRPAQSLAGRPEEAPTPFLPREQAATLDRVELESLPWHDLTNLKLRTLPQTMYHVNTPPELARLTREIENYSASRAETGPADDPATAPTPPPLHRQIAGRINENFELVRQEIERWREGVAQAKTFQTELQTQYDETAGQLGAIFEHTTAALEAEIAPAARQLEADSDFYRQQIETTYQARRQAIEAGRDAELEELNRTGGDLENDMDEKSDEYSLVQAEYKGLNDQRDRLESSTDNRFATLKSELRSLIHRSYTLPPVPIFRSDYPVELTARSAEECLQQLAELRVETRQATTAINRAINHFARVRYEPLDELAQLETQIAHVSKWQSVAYLGSLINFRQIGQLLELASEVSNVAGIYLEAVADFDNLNRRWCALKNAIDNLGLSAYAGRLQEAQEYLMSLQQLISSLHSNLISAAHNPDMARPGTFQSIYEQATGLQRELEELGALTGQLVRLEERLALLAEELSALNSQLEANKAEVEKVGSEAEARLNDIAGKEKFLLERLEQLKAGHLRQMRAHIEEVRDSRERVTGALHSGRLALNESALIEDTLLRQHIIRAETLLAEARRLHQGLEKTLARIVSDFEAGVIPDRYLQAPSELLVPVWYFQFKERPVWQPRMLGFASCYRRLEPVGGATTAYGRPRSSLWRYLTSGRPATRYRLQDDNQLETLVGALNLEYPAGKIDVTGEWLRQLGEEGWVDRWAVRVLARASSRRGPD